MKDKFVYGGKLLLLVVTSPITVPLSLSLPILIPICILFSRNELETNRADYNARLTGKVKSIGV